jgi:CRISPR system Cascade subunit CasD
MTSWGDIAVGEHRRSFAQPSKSAALGLIAAALGIRRTEEQRLNALHTSFGFAYCVENPGTLLRDYHTIQAPSASTGIHYTRRDELAVEPEKLNTLLSAREYRCDAQALIGLWERDLTAYRLDDLRVALRQPHFTLYLGRKSCPPALPLDPAIISTDNGVHEAFLLYFQRNAMRLSLPPRDDRELSVAADADADPVGALEHDRIIRRDVPSSRARWQFAERWEIRTVIPRPSEDAS